MKAALRYRMHPANAGSVQQSGRSLCSATLEGYELQFAARVIFTSPLCGARAAQGLDKACHNLPATSILIISGAPPPAVGDALPSSIG